MHPLVLTLLWRAFQRWVARVKQRDRDCQLCMVVRNRNPNTPICCQSWYYSSSHRMECLHPWQVLSRHHYHHRWRLNRVWEPQRNSKRLLVLPRVHYQQSFDRIILKRWRSGVPTYPHNRPWLLTVFLHSSLDRLNAQFAFRGHILVHQRCAQISFGNQCACQSKF